MLMVCSSQWFGLARTTRTSPRIFSYAVGEAARFGQVARLTPTLVITSFPSDSRSEVYFLQSFKWINSLLVLRANWIGWPYHKPIGGYGRYPYTPILPSRTLVLSPFFLTFRIPSVLFSQAPNPSPGSSRSLAHQHSTSPLLSRDLSKEVTWRSDEFPLLSLSYWFCSRLRDSTMFLFVLWRVMGGFMLFDVFVHSLIAPLSLLLD